jgi:hypothetical protein
MTQNQNNRFSMYSATAKVLSDNDTKISAVPALANAFGRFEGLLSQIRDKDKERSSKTPGKVAAKDEAEDALVMATIIVSSALAAFARVKGNAQLREAAHVTESTLRTVRMNEQLNIARVTYDLAKANAMELVGFGVSQTMLDDLKSRIAAYELAMKDVSSGMAERTGAKTAVSELFVQAYDVLKQELDPLMQIFRVTDPEFFNDFRAARVVKDIGVRHTKNNSTAKTPAAGSPN